MDRGQHNNLQPKARERGAVINALGETFSLTSAPTTIRPALTAETRENIRKTARSGAAKRRTLGEAELPIKR